MRIQNKTQSSLKMLHFSVYNRVNQCHVAKRIFPVTENVVFVQLLTVQEEDIKISSLQYYAD